LFEWFCSIKRSVKGRVTPAYVLRRAKLLNEAYITAHLKQGLQADAPVMNHQWLQRWRFEYNISLRKPNRKWKIPRAILEDRLETMWLNVVRVRAMCKLIHGNDPAMINFDQSPFYMNEAGSKAGKTMEFKGKDKVVIREGHSATRERWTANTAVRSPQILAEAGGTSEEILADAGGNSAEILGEAPRTAAAILAEAGVTSAEILAEAGGDSAAILAGAGGEPKIGGLPPRPPPPLEVMFKCTGSGKRMNPRLQSCVPEWAPWLTVVLSPKGSYREEHVLNYLEEILDPWVEGRDWRILLADAYAPQMTDAVRRCAWLRGYVLIIHGGGTTGITQVNDTDLHQLLKRLYMELEQGAAAEYMRLNPGGCPVPRKEDCMAWLAAIWAQPWVHTLAEAGFAKTGLAVALDGSQDHLICREAGSFWSKLGMSEKREQAIHNVKSEVEAGRLAWNYDDVASIVVPFTEQKRRHDVFPDDEGSSEDDGEHGSSDDDPDNMDWGAGGSKLGPSEILAEAGPPPSETLADAGPTPSDISTDVVAVPLDPAEADEVNRHRIRLANLDACKEQLGREGSHPGLLVMVERAMHAEERRARGRAQTNPRVAAALLSERRVELGDLARRQTALNRTRREASNTAMSMKQMREAQLALEQRRLALHNASTVYESMAAVKSFDAGDLGQGHEKGGTAEHTRNRMNVLERIRLRGAPLPPEQQNDWEWFKRNWDAARLRFMEPSRRASWGSQFKNIAQEILQKIADGETDALSKFFAHQARQYLAMPSLRV